jgi:hypothetical protein
MRVCGRDLSDEDPRRRSRSSRARVAFDGVDVDVDVTVPLVATARAQRPRVRGQRRQRQSLAAWPAARPGAVAKPDEHELQVARGFAEHMAVAGLT